MIKSKRESNSHSQRSSKSANVKAATELILDINNIQGRRLRSILSVSIQNIRTVHQLKKAITSRHGLSVQELLYRGVWLADDQQLAHLMPSLMKIGKSPRFSVRTRLCTTPRPGDVSLFVKSLQGASFWQVHLPSQSTIADLKNAIRHSEGYSSQQDFQLTCGGKLLSGENLSLTTCNVVSDSLVHVVRKLLGGGMAWEWDRGPPQTFVDMENMDSLRTSIWTAGRAQKVPAKPWQRINLGLNIRGKCPNVQCAAYRCDVWCRKGYTVYNIAEPVHCPSCYENITATTCKFWGCQWMFEGRKTGVDVMSKWHVTTQEEFQWFDDNDGKNTAIWSSLVITVRRLDDSGLESEEDVHENCVLCFGPTDESALLPKNTPDVTCGHAVHTECAREFVLAGYKTCRMCRLTIGH